MKTKRIFKMALSMFMAIVTLVTVASVSCFSGAAADNEITYKITVNNAGSLGVSAGEIYFDIRGVDGRCTTVFLPAIGLIRGKTIREVKAPDVGQISGITIHNNTVFDDDWYPNTVIIESPTSDPVTLYVGRWCGQTIQDVYRDDRIAILDVKTGGVAGAGTDCDVFATLYDTKGVSSGEINLSEICYYVNAFEKKSEEYFVIKLPQEFGTLEKVVFRTSDGSSKRNLCEWFIESIKVSIKRPGDSTYTCSINCWLSNNGTLACYV